MQDATALPVIESGQLRITDLEVPFEPRIGA